jgi:hypothetical protein
MKVMKDPVLLILGAMVCLGAVVVCALPALQPLPRAPKYANEAVDGGIYLGSLRAAMQDSEDGVAGLDCTSQTWYQCPV